jgi:hypothetical protein
VIAGGVRAIAAAFGVAPPGRASAALHWRIGAFCGIALVLVLPVLLAARQLAAPARADELARLEAAFAPARPAAAEGALARRWYLAAARSAAAMPDDPAARQQLVARARVAQVAALAGVVLLAWLVVALARGRLHALLACAAFALLPPVAAEGHVLRAETPAALFAAFALLLLQLLAAVPAGRAGAAARARARSRWALAACAALAIAVAVAMLPASAAVLVVPGVVLTIAGVQLLLRLLRVARRGGWARAPVRAVNGRLLPWTAIALGAPALSLWLLLRTGAASSAASGVAPSELGVLPDGIAGAALTVLAVLGAAAFVLRAGARLRRRGRIAPDLVLMVHCAVVFGGTVACEPGLDRLPLALAAAVLLAEGTLAAVLLVQWAAGARRRVNASRAPR